MDVARWIEGLGLGQYAAAFSDNDIDFELLRTISDADLKEIGIASLGHRRKILAAAAALGSLPAPPPSAAAPVARENFDAERRPITVMFCDLVGSTGMAAKLDPEDWRDLVGGYLDECSKAVAGYGGHVLKKLGDGIMALFGYPKAQENDAERAVRAALAILRALEALNATNVAKGLPALAARIGLESGPVVVDQAGEVFGDAPNVAARVQAAAEPGTLLVTASIQRQVAGLFVAEDKGPHELKGVTGRPNLYRLVRASGGGRRIRAGSLTPLVGREEELAHLVGRWERARAGYGQLVQIVGEPGLGKSRLMEEFRTRLAETPHTWVEWSSSQLLQNTPLHPVAEWGRQRFGGPDISGEKRLAELDAALTQAKIDPTEHTPLIAPLLDIPVPPDRAVQFAPEEMRRRQLAAIVAWILAGARVQPLVLAFEDLHWADPTSFDLMKTLAERGAQAPLMIVATARPEFRAPWATRSHHGVISLAPLDRVEIRRMVGAIAERHALSKETIEGVADRTEGVPLFVEEVTRLLLEGGAQTVPPTLQQSLAARLDRLGEARELAQIGAVLGREFSYGLLNAVAGLPEPALQASLERLADADLLFAEGIAPSASYRFKHALIQDAAYDSLLKSRRQATHRRAAEALAASENPQPELVAYHFTQSLQNDLAIEWWGKAGDAALRRSAYQEAITHLGKAIEMADREGGKREKKGETLKLQVSLGNATIALRGHWSRETTAVFDRARELAAGGEDIGQRLSVVYGLWAGHYTRGELAQMRERAEAFRRECAVLPVAGETSVALRMLGVTDWFAGDFAAACEHLERSLAILDPARDGELALRFGQDIGVSALAYSSLVLRALGKVDLARQRASELAARVAPISHGATIAYGNIHLAIIECQAGNRERAAPFVRSVADISRTRNLSLFSLVALALEGWLDWRAGRRGEGLAKMRQGVQNSTDAGIVTFEPLWAHELANFEAASDEPDAALATISRSLAGNERTGQRWYDAALHGLRGDVLLQQNPAAPAAAESAWLTALAIASEQGARTFAMQAALNLAKLYRTTNRSFEAHDILAPALEGFAPTPEMPEIAEALKLLASLATERQA
jgi:class 3 adenylate cyclase/tetratricopeptide (TPR) repeat protein